MLSLFILNGLLLIVALVLAVIKNSIVGIELFKFEFPFKLYMICMLLSNLVYIMGNLFEVVYLLLWKKEINVFDFEKKFFKASIAMILIVNGTGIALFFVDFFK